MTPREELAAAQAALVAALVAGGPPPAGFDPERLEATARALLRKRAGEVARAWPLLAAGYGPRWPVAFAEWARGRPPRGSWLDGWDFARAHRGSLGAAAALELLRVEAEWRYDAGAEPRRRRFFASRAPGGVLVRAFGRTRLLAPRARRPA
jgi:hypothetical protein